MKELEHEVLWLAVEICMDENLVDPIDFYLSKALDNIVLVRLLVERGK